MGTATETSTVCFSAANNAAIPNPDGTKEDTYMATSGSVMVVDDDPFLLESVFALLRANGLAVRPYQDGMAALAGFYEATPDVVLTDIKMPSFSGIQLVEKIRVVDAKTPVIFMTGEPEIALTDAGRSAFAFMIKPVDPQALVNAVKQGIDHKRWLEREKNQN